MSWKEKSKCSSSVLEAAALLYVRRHYCPVTARTRSLARSGASVPRPEEYRVSTGQHSPPVTDLLDFSDQDRYRSGMEEDNRNPDHRSDDVGRSPAAGSSSETTDVQVSVQDFIDKNGFRTRLKARGRVSRVRVSSGSSPR